MIIIEILVSFFGLFINTIIIHNINLLKVRILEKEFVVDDFADFAYCFIDLFHAESKNERMSIYKLGQVHGPYALASQMIYQHKRTLALRVLRNVGQKIEIIRTIKIIIQFPQEFLGNVALNIVDLALEIESNQIMQVLALLVLLFPADKISNIQMLILDPFQILGLPIIRIIKNLLLFYISLNYLGVLGGIFFLEFFLILAMIRVEEILLVVRFHRDWIDNRENRDGSMVEIDGLNGIGTGE